MMRATERAHLLLSQSIKPGDWVIDATVGNGHDTLFLAKLVGPSGRVLGFDVQETALAVAAKLVDEMPQVTLIHDGHENLAKHLPANDAANGEGQLSAVMFNLGYLPGGSKDIITGSQTTMSALKQALDHLKLHGLVTVVLYPGHPGGEEEADAVRSFTQDLPQDFDVLRHARTNTLAPAPELFVIERVGFG
jgi:predicted methyltransferase